MRAARDLLRRLTETYPPPPGSSHSFSLAEGALVLYLRRGTSCASFTMSEEDLDLDPPAFLEVLATMMPERK